MSDVKAKQSGRSEILSQKNKLNNQKQSLMQNLNKQSVLSHKISDAKSSLNEKQKQFPSKQQNTKRSTFANSQQNSFITPIGKNKKHRNIFANQQEKNDEPQLPREQDNEFLSEQQIQNRLMIAGYFKNASKQVQALKLNKLAQKYSSKVQDNVNNQITKGTVNIDKHQQNIKNLLVEFKMSEQQIKQLQKKVYRQVRNQKNKLLDPYHLKQVQKKRKHTERQQSQSQQNLIIDNFVSKTILSKQEHKKLIKRFVQSRKLVQKKHKQQLFKDLQKQRSLSHQKIKLEQQNLKKQKEKRKNSIQENLLKKKEKHQSFILQQKVSNQRYHSMKKQKFLYQDMEDRYKSQILIPSLQEKKVKLKQIRDFQKKYDITEIKKHQAQYLQKKSQQSNKALSRHKIQNFHYHPPQGAKNISRILQQQNVQTKIKFQQKKRVLEENKIRQMNFLSDVRIKFKPKIDVKKREQLEIRLKSQESQAIKKPSENDIKLLGMKHLEVAKKKGKKNKEKHKTQGNDMLGNKCQQQAKGVNLNARTYIKIPISKPNSNSKRANKSFSNSTNPHIDINQSKRKQIRKIVNSNQLQRETKLQRLKMQNERINEIYKRKQKFFRENEDNQRTREEAIGLLLNSIQTKMGIIDVCTKY